MISAPSTLVPVIDPVPVGTPRPFWSVMIPTFNCSHLVGATIESVLSQALEGDRMEIVVVDDASEDDIAGVVAKYGDRIRFVRNQTNLGVPHNLTKCIRLSRGELIHLLHGDDQVRDGFYRAMAKAFADEQVGAAYCRQIFMNETGDWIAISPLVQDTDGPICNALPFLAAEQRIMTPSICVRRQVYERLGGFHPLLTCAEDWEMWVRIASHYSVSYIRDPLAVYRMQEGSNTGRNMRTGADVDLTKFAIQIIHSHLPQHLGKSVSKQARETYARSALLAAEKFASSGDLSAAVAQFKAALRLSNSPMLLHPLIRASLKVGRCIIGRQFSGGANM